MEGGKGVGSRNDKTSLRPPPPSSALNGKQLLLMSRDTNFSAAFRDVLNVAGVESVSSPPRSPNLNSHLERFMCSIEDECVSRMISFGEASPRNAVRQFLEHYNAEGPHQGAGNTRLRRFGEKEPPEELAEGAIQCRERLGGLLKHYYRRAA